MTNNEHADALAEFRAQLIERLKKRKEIRKGRGRNAGHPAPHAQFRT